MERLVFDCFRPFRLKSLLLHSQSDGYRTIELRDEQGNLIDSRSLYLNIGSHRVDLDFQIEVGKNWQLSLADQGNLFRHIQGASYPYEVPGIVTIKRSSQGKEAYFYFYDWQIESESPCERQAVQIEGTPGNTQASFLIDTLGASQPEFGIFQFWDQSVSATNWLWDFGDGQSSSLQHPIHTFLDTGLFVVSLFASGPDGCGDAFQLEVEVDSLIASHTEDGENRSWISVYPNPGNGAYWLRQANESRMIKEVFVYDLLGNQVWRSRWALGDQEHTIDLHGQASGIYLLSVRSAAHSWSRRLILFDE